jgi:hypothetical protein
MGELLFSRSARLFQRPSFKEGLSRALDIQGNYPLYNVNISGEIADMEALYSDWASVGDHLIYAIEVK